MAKEPKKTEYFLGLDVGTDSVGYAVTGEDYKLLKFRGEPMWGVHLFDAAESAEERRLFRTARRRIDRRQQRIRLAQEIFAKEIAGVDRDFYLRIKESALFKIPARGAENITLISPFSLPGISFSAVKFCEEFIHEMHKHYRRKKIVTQEEL